MSRVLLKTIIILIFCFVICSCYNCFASDTLKSKIVVLQKTGDNYRNLKSNDRVNAGDSICILIFAQSNLNVYVVYSDDESTRILTENSVNKEISYKLNVGDKLILPSMEDMYVFDELTSPIEITIFCSNQKLREFEDRFEEGSNMTPALWKELKSEIEIKYKLKLDDQRAKPYPIAGNVRGEIDEFLDDQPILIGKNIILRNYIFEIQK